MTFHTPAHKQNPPAHPTTGIYVSSDERGRIRAWVGKEYHLPTAAPNTPIGPFLHIDAVRALLAPSAPSGEPADHVPASVEQEAATDAALGMMLLPQIRVSAHAYAVLKRIAEVRGMVLQAVVREALEPGETMGAAPQAAPAPQAEPVAWAQLGLRNGHTYVRMHYEGHLYPPPADVQRNLNLVPLYAASQPAPAQAEHAPTVQPLSDAEAQALWVAATIERTDMRSVYLRGLRDGERAHGITATTAKGAAS